MVEGVRRITDHRATLDPRPQSAIPDTQQTDQIDDDAQLERSFLDKIEYLDDFITVEIKRKPLEIAKNHIKRAKQQVEKRDKIIEVGCSIFAI